MKNAEKHDIYQDRRAARLAEWFSTRPIPAAEKSYISQLINKKTSFGEKSARRLERDYGMGEGWLNQPEGGEKLPAVVDADRINIEEYDVSFAMGAGQLATTDAPEVIQVWQVTPEWLHVFLPEFRGNPKMLKIAKGVGDCLSTSYRSGDMLLIDISHKSQPLRTDGMYVFRWEGLLYIKELRPIGQRRAAAHDQDGKAFDIDYAKDDFELIAKVVKAWRMQR